MKKGLEPCDKAQSLRFSPRICDTVAKFAPVRALWARRVERSGAGGGKSQNKKPEAIASGLLFWLPLLDSNQRPDDVVSVTTVGIS